MDLESKLDELLRVAEEIGLHIRHEPQGGEGGGFCVINGRRQLFVDTMADPATRYEHTLEALASLPELEERFLRPDVREDIELQRCRG